MPPIPFYLVPLIFVLVVLPSCTAVFLRLVLYSHLAYLLQRVKKLIREGKINQDLEQNLDQEPEIIKRLITRFKKSSGVLEQVNTPALIDQIYSQEKVRGVYCEQIDYFCRILPNLLLAFGLLLTFLGITISLTALSSTFSQTNYSDVSILVHNLQTPLQGMGAAFIASLVGLSFSTVLTLFNLKFNTVLAKFQLISSLEDYLDNIYQPTIEGHSRLDKAVEKMVSQFSDFLGRFGETVREAVESPLKDNIKAIRDASVKASDLANEVNGRLLDASGTLERGAVIFLESAEVIERTQFPDNLSTLTEGLANAQREFSHSTLVMNDSMKFTESATKLLHISVVEIGHLSKQTAQVLELTQSSQQSLSEIIPQLHQGGQIFQTTVHTLDQLQQGIGTKENSLGDIQVELAKLVETLKQHTEQVCVEIKEGFNHLQIPIKPQPLPVEFEEALIAYKNGNYIEAAKIINKLIPIYPKQPQFYLLQGNIYSRLNNYDFARKAYELALSISYKLKSPTSKDLELRKDADAGIVNMDAAVKIAKKNSLNK